MDDQTQDKADLNTALSGNYMLVTLAISRWTARKPDKALAAEAAAAHGATPEAVTATRKLMAGADTELKAVETALNAARSYLYQESLPWSTADNDSSKRGPRLVPIKKAMDIIAKLKQHQDEFSVAMTEFKGVYAQRVTDALRNQGTLADATAYPDVSQLDDMFTVRLDITPVPAQGDFSRMSIPANLAQALGGRMAQRHNVAVNNAMSDLHGRISAAVGNMATVLSKHAAGEKTRMYTSLITNVQVLGALLRDTNFTDDAAITAMADRIDELTEYDIGMIKSSPALAGDLAKKATAIVEARAQQELVTQAIAPAPEGWTEVEADAPADGPFDDPSDTRGFIVPGETPYRPPQDPAVLFNELEDNPPAIDDIVDRAVPEPDYVMLPDGTKLVLGDSDDTLDDTVGDILLTQQLAVDVKPPVAKAPDLGEDLFDLDNLLG